MALQQVLARKLQSNCVVQADSNGIREPLVQASPVAANVFIWMSFFVALLNYVRFAREVIWQMLVTFVTGLHKNATADELVHRAEPSTLASRASQ